MSARRIGIWQRIRSNFVFVPATALGSGVLAGLAMLAIEAPLAEWLGWQPGLMGGPDASRAALTAIATSSLTIAALAVSLTLAVLTYAGAQYSPRVLKTFLADAVSQASIGLLLAVHAYSLVVLRGHGSGEPLTHAAPEIATGLGVIAGFVAVALLVYYVHHLASSLRASQVVAAIAHEAGQLLDDEAQAWRAKQSGPTDAERSSARHGERSGRVAMQNTGHPVVAASAGYVIAIDIEALERVAEASGAHIEFERALGGFVAKGETIARVEGPAETEPEAQAREVQRHVVIGPHPESDQDAYSCLGQLVDLALRALSPGLNDPHSASLAIDRLGDLLARRARLDREIGPQRARTRVFVPRRSAVQLLRVCLQPIRQNAGGQGAVLHRLIEALHRIADADGEDTSLRIALAAEAGALGRAIDREMPDEHDAAPLRQQLARLRASIGAAVDADATHVRRSLE